jgi:Ca-activated chloride channel family protein
MNRLRCSLNGLALAIALSACAPVPSLPAQAPPEAPDAPKLAAAPSGRVVAAGYLPLQATDQPGARRSGTWIGAAGESDYVLPGVNDTMLGVWIDVPTSGSRARAPADVALVIDTSGSMAGPKIENARAAARELIEKLADGDIVSVIAFSDEARVVAAPTRLGPSSRALVLRSIASLTPMGGTNMFDGLGLAEANATSAPATHPVRRVVMISDGIANIGPTSPEMLGSVAARGAERGVQVSAIGVGLDYDERTLNAHAVRSSGRLYHLDEPREMTAILDREIGMLQTTAATSAAIEVVPAQGVTILGADGLAMDRMGMSVRIPLGAMFEGQHREMLLRVRIDADASAGEAGHALASVRLRFNDPSNGGLERVQEIVARYQVTADAQRVEASLNGSRTHAISATLSASQLTIAAAQQVNVGRFDAADQKLAEAEAKLQQAAKRARNDADRTRVLAAAAHLGKARAATKADAAAPAPARRARALELNQAGMHDAGF